MHTERGLLTPSTHAAPRKGFQEGEVLVLASLQLTLSITVATLFYEFSRAFLYITIEWIPVLFFMYSCSYVAVKKCVLFTPKVELYLTQEYSLTPSHVHTCILSLQYVNNERQHKRGKDDRLRSR